MVSCLNFLSTSLVFASFTINPPPPIFPRNGFNCSVIFLHGGPGGSTSIKSTAFFDPSVYRVVLLDQRGAGKSTPAAELRENTSQHLVSDIEVLRRHLDIPRWHMVFGGSWGSTLALLYAQTHPEAVGSLVLRGIFTVRKSELDWFYKDGASHIFPDFHEAFINYLPEDDRKDPISAYYKLLTSDDYATRLAAAKAWSGYELATSTILINEESLRKVDDDVWALAHSRIEAHYFKHGAWLEDGQLLKKGNIDKIRHIPGERDFYLGKYFKGMRKWTSLSRTNVQQRP
jgi:proline iminopeptidase